MRHGEATSEAARILVVDDIPDNRTILTRRLERQGHSVVECENGELALELMSERPFDLVLLDIMMPVMNGYEVLEKMRGDRRLRHIPVIVISAVEEIESTVKCIELGAEDYLSKPFNPVLLRARVEACLEKKRLRDQEQYHLKRIEDEKKRADELLEVILPKSIAEELRRTNEVKPRRYESAVVLFADVVGFTEYCDQRSPDEVLNNLQQMVYAFEELVSEYGLLKLKTIGDSFMAAAGLLNDVVNPATDPVTDSVQCGLAMITSLDSLKLGWNLRVGIHTGPLVAGVVGHRQYLFDVWGDTVNTASRIEAHGAPGAVNLSRQAWEKVSSHFECASTQTVAVKGKGDLQIFQVTRRLSQS